MGITPPEAQEELDRVLAANVLHKAAGNYLYDPNVKFEWLEARSAQLRRIRRGEPAGLLWQEGEAGGIDVLIEKPKREMGDAERAAEYLYQAQRYARIWRYAVIVTILTTLLLIPLVVTYWQWMADMNACMRFFHLTWQNCSDYLRLIAD